MNLRAVANVLVMGLVACSSGSVLPGNRPESNAPVSAHRVPLALRIFIPTRAARGRRSHGVLHQQFIANSSAGIQMKVYPHGLRLGQVASLTGNISSSSHSCRTVSAGRVCSFAVAVPPRGPYDFVLKTYDQPPSGGTIPGGALQLGAAVDTASIAAGKANALHFTIGGVAARTFIHLGTGDVLHAIASRELNASAGAFDADGNLIASDGYVDASGNPVAITPVADSMAGSTISFTPAKFSTPQTGGITLRYSAIAANASQLADGFTTVIKAKASSAAANGSFPLAVQAPFETSVPTSAGPHDIVVQSGDWFVSASTGHAIDTVQNGSVGTLGLAPSVSPYGLAGNANGHVWFAEAGSDQLGYVLRVPPASLVFVYGAVSLTSGAAPIGMTNGPDGAMWFTEQGTNTIGRVTDSPTTPLSVTEYPVPTSASGLQLITTGPDGAMWFTECGSGKIGRIPVNATPGSSAQIHEFTVPLSGGAHPYGIVSGADGALWFTDFYTAYIGRMTTSGAVTRYAIPSGKAAGQIAVAADGTMWFTEVTGDNIGRILTSATTAHPGILEFPTPDSGGGPFGITTDSDGAVYFTEIYANKAVELQ